MKYSTSEDVKKAMETADDYERDTVLIHLYNVLKKHENIAFEKQRMIEDKKNTPIGRKK